MFRKQTNSYVGITAFVLPEHLWIGEYFITFREHTYKHWKEVTSLKEGYFEAVNNPASLMILSKEVNESFVVGKSLSDKIVTRRTQNKDFIRREIQLGSRGQEVHTFKLFFNLDYLTLKQTMLDKSDLLYLDKLCIVADGIQTANVLTEIMTTETPAVIERYTKALRKGKAIICRYCALTWDGWWVLKPEFATSFKRPGFSYASPRRMFCFQAAKKIVMRQTEPTILATIDTEGFYFPNSIFQCVIKEEFQDKFSLEFVLGLLNSTFIRQYYLLASQVEGTTKPQLYINILKSLPIPNATPAEQGAISSKVEAILAAKAADAGADVSDLEREIDELVAALYGLDEDEKKLVGL